MFKNYFKTTYRYLKNNKLFTAINLLGLAIALCVTYFAILYVRFEVSYDDFNPNKDRVYRISTDIKTGTGIKQETSNAALAFDLATAFPEVEKTTRVFLDYYIVQKDKEPATEETMAYADSSMFSVFAFSLERGTIDKIFSAPYNLVLSETYAKRYFGSTDCIGKTLKLDGNTTATITGVMKDMPLNSHFRTDMLLSMSSLIQPGTSWMDNRSRFGFSTYVLLKPNANSNLFKQKLDAYAKEHPLNNGQIYDLILEPLSGLYLHGSIRENKAGATAHGNEANIYIFSVVAIFVLLIACFNFINLTTAFSLQRAREVGIRKVAGATKQQLIIQFLADAVTLMLISFFIAVILAVIFLPSFNALAGKIVIKSIGDNINYVVIFLAGSFCLGVLSGLYPAIFLSSFKTIRVLKQKSLKTEGGYGLRKVLVVSQFVVSITLIIATLVIFHQLDYMQNANLGFKKEHNLVIDYHYDQRITEHPQFVASAFEKIPDITNVSMASCIPGRANKTFSTTFLTANGNNNDFQFDGWYADDNFLNQYGIKLIAGRGFSPAFKNDGWQSMIINEATCIKLGFTNPKDVIGKTFSRNNATGIIIGVVKDFHFHSAHEAVQPLTIQKVSGFYTFLTLTINAINVRNTVSAVEKEWNQLAPGLPMIYFFSDDTYNMQYKSEARFGNLFTCFAAIAIIISCLGLLGLSAFNTTQRTKEIGIRKVLGASVASITGLLAKEFILLVLIAFIIAVPLAWYFMHQWLQDFAYRTPIQWWIFIVAGLSALLISLITVSFQSIKAAIANPVKSLKTE